ncbi:hypothetical protein GCM10011376_32410 [Nocardioides flavus (ex Wang et al. 2016)]|uniref:Mycothiol-dependent maleylpyruvate isomerase metal-binding domain-containing protein n=1 Tax=Nocardioides flavus (ex Wang et al. 2016) TaxID=2058780 RepID=A0ABQ3HPH0_9ACTN|nr:maleylpyruvate isomerase family mycothiol-dependent enzyme [Nocardioides flavus (ex Wang et al. 2016)]GHE18631.1 hypothetical protein GCM10011376_32410 [Nocardioides flavus (ex Wang et al. 2016)]
MTTAPTLPDLVRRERTAFVDTLEQLDAEQWLAQTLCSQWRVVDVAAHLAWAPVLGPVAGATAMLRHGFSMNRMIAASAVEWSRRGRDAILNQLRDNAHTGARPIGMPPVAALADAVVHGLDVRRPLGLSRPIPAAALAPVAHFSLRTRWPMNVVVGGSARRRVAGVRLVATDTDWSYGEGPEVRGSAEALLLLLYGRRPAPGELNGPGADMVAQRLAAVRGTP